MERRKTLDDKFRNGLKVRKTIKAHVHRLK